MHTPAGEDLAEAEEAIHAAAAGIRAREFTATPAYQVCRTCAYTQICPSTATRE
ncbi:MAG: PD-(D/E)XK nuclease family protein [Candidatus Rokubacteria bacterium]|nr:PD-(D/E)XK nuclease family protein [Candidatus Rokubacteria bacterium]